MKRTISLVAIVFMSFSTANVSAEEPRLVINPGGHKGLIKDVMFTRDGRYLVSAGVDKVIHVWNAQKGAIVRTIRGQIGDGHDGKIFAAALAPDDRYLAVAGWLVDDKGKNGAIRIHDFRSGAVIGILDGHTDSVHTLAISPDGRYMASGSSDETVRLWDVEQMKQVHIFRGHTEPIYALAFSPDGERLASGGEDDTLRLWDLRRRKLITKMTEHEYDVRSVAFSPDGRYIASGSDGKTIRLWNARTGAFIKVLGKRASHQVKAVAFSPDSTWLVEASAYTSRVVSVPSGRVIARFKKHTNILLGVTISHDGKIVATGGGGRKEIYLWNPRNGKVIKKLGGKGQQVWSVGFAANGRSIAFGNKFDYKGGNHRGPLQTVILFNQDGDYKVTLGGDVKQESNYLRAVDRYRDYELGRKKVGPYKNVILQIIKDGKVLYDIERDSTSGFDHRSYTFTRNGRYIISGGSVGVLTLYNRKTGKKVHDFLGHTGDVWAVAVSPDNRTLVSGSADQTVKLWDIASGRNLLTIFIGTDREWVAWIPEGFFTASPGGERFIGYHLNNGSAKAADFVGVDQLGELFYRPDLVASSLERDERPIQGALARIGDVRTVLASGLPPKLKVAGPSEVAITDGHFRLRLEVTERGGGRGRVEYRVNGVKKAPATSRLPDIKGAKGENLLGQDFTLPPGRNEIETVVYNRNGTIASRGATVVVHMQAPETARPTLHILAVGIDRYRDVDLRLRFAAKDAKAVAATLTERGRTLFNPGEVKVLVDGQATKTAIETAFKTLQTKIQPRDVFVFYLAGHGVSSDGRYHFFPWGLIYENEEVLRERSLSEKDIAKLLATIPAQKSLIIIDTCHAGAAINLAALQPGTRGPGVKHAISRLMRSTGWAVLAASSSSQVALEGHKGHGVFTYAFLEGLRGEADTNRDRQISIDELSGYLQQEVPKITMQRFGFEQFPMRNVQGHSFTIGWRERGN